MIDWSEVFDGLARIGTTLAAIWIALRLGWLSRPSSDLVSGDALAKARAAAAKNGPWIEWTQARAESSILGEPNPASPPARLPTLKNAIASLDLALDPKPSTIQFDGLELRQALALLAGSIWTPPRQFQDQPLPDGAQVETRFGFGHHEATHQEDRITGIWSRVVWPNWTGGNG